jgi:F-box and leucine-rich repeat protein GRR1
MSIVELSGLPNLRRLSIVRVHKVTDLALYNLGEHATGLERLLLSYCDKLTMEGFHFLLKRLERLEHVVASGIPALKRIGVERFSKTAPPVE